MMLIVSDTATYKAYAKSWTEDADTSIYNGTPNSENNDELIEKVTNDVADRGVGLVEGYLSDLVVSLTDGLYLILERVGITMDSVVYGRVGGHAKDGIAYFTFELEKGNPYGVVGAIIYTIVAGISIVYLVVILFGKYSIFTFMSASAKKRSEFKSFLGTGILALFMIILMPYFLDVALYLRDLTLSIVSKDGARELFNNSQGVNLVSHFRDLAIMEDSGIVNALMYLSTVLLSLYLGCLYVGYAMSFLVCFICFPIICTAMNIDKKLMSQWVRQVFSIIITPVMDCILFMVPLFIGYLPNSANLAVLQIFLCAMVVPSRNVIRQLLGLGSTGLDFAGVATMMGAARLAGSAGRAFHNFREGKRAAAADNSMANYYQELADMENISNVGGSGTSEGISAPGGGIGTPGGGSGGGGISPSSGGGAASTGSVSYMGAGANPIFAKYADTQNFDNVAFRGKLSNQQMADLYRQRATDHNAKANASALGSLAGGFVGLGGSMFMSPGTAANIGAMGIGAGGSFGAALSQGPGLHKLNPQKSVTYDPIETFSGTVDEDVQLTPYYKSEGLAYDNVDFNSDAFYQVNRECAAVASNSIIAGYYVNNGEKLKQLYNKVEADNNGKGMNNSQIRGEFIKTAKTQMMDEFNASIIDNKNMRYSGNKEIDETGMKILNSKFDDYLNDNSKGILSEAFLDAFDWMPKKVDNSQE